MKMRWLAVGIWLGLSMATLGCGDKPAAAQSEAQADDSSKDVYACPMRCKLEGQDTPYEQHKPGKCPVCGMPLEKKK